MTGTELIGQLRRKGLLYWVRVVVLMAIGTVVGDWLGRQEIWVDLRYRIYQAQHASGPRKPLAERTAVVLIGDDEYWKGELGRRVPIKRRYLAKLVRELDSANPAVIALDFDLASPLPDGSLVEHSDYRPEKTELLNVIKRASMRRKIVLPRTVDLDEQQRYVLRSDIYDRFDFGKGRQNIYMGYIALPYDIRQVPLTLKLHGGGSVDSFATAIVRAYHAKALLRVPEGDSLPYGSYLRAGEFRQLSARDVLKGRRETLEQLAHKIVILGGAWHKQGYGRGDQIDTYFTPVGWIGGAFIHANYVEALLDGRVYEALDERIVKGIEIILVLLGAMIFALEIRPSRKWMAASVLCVILVVVNYFILQNLGEFFDFFVPLVLIAAHAVLDQVLEWRSLAVAYRNLQEGH